MRGWDYETGDTIIHSSFAAERTLITGFAVKTMPFFKGINNNNKKKFLFFLSIVFEANPEICVLHDYIYCLLTPPTHFTQVQVAVARQNEKLFLT